jgi:predicted esterase
LLKKIFFFLKEYTISQGGKNKEIIYMTPKLEKYSKTLIWLHGLGDEGQSFIGLFDEDISPFPSDVKIVLPTAK